MIFSTISHYLRFISKQSIILVIVLASSFFYNQTQNIKYSNCKYTEDIRFVDIATNNSIIFNIKSQNNSIEERRNIEIIFDDIVIPEKFGTKPCESDVNKNAFFYISRVLSEARHTSLTIKNCRLIKTESSGSLLLDGKTIQEILIKQGVAVKKYKPWEFWKKVDFCENAMQVKSAVKAKKKSRF